MAGDWLKIEACTPDKPEVFGIATALGVTQQHAFGCVFLVWRWFDQHTVQGNAAGVTKNIIDALAVQPGMADAMVKVGWLDVLDDGSVSLPHFDRHTGQTAKTRALTAKRVAKTKGKSNAKGNDEGNGASVTSALPREEKRREDIKPKSKDLSAHAAQTKGTRLPEDWVLPKPWGEWALNERPELTADEVRKMADTFKDHWIANANRATGKKADWFATWRNWVRNQKTNPAQSKSVQEARLDVARQIFGDQNGTHRPIRDITPGRTIEGDGASIPETHLSLRKPDAG
mgnify:CR=1 FL=1